MNLCRIFPRLHDKRETREVHAKIALDRPQILGGDSRVILLPSAQVVSFSLVGRAASISWPPFLLTRQCHCVPSVLAWASGLACSRAGGLAPPFRTAYQPLCSREEGRFE